MTRLLLSFLLNIYIISSLHAQNLLLLSQVRDQITIPEYTEQEKRLVLKQATVLLEEMYVHKNLKKKSFHFNPTPQLNNIRANIDNISSTSFHDQLNSIFNQARDTSHTKYYYPAPRGCYTSYLSLFFEYVQSAHLQKRDLAVSWIEPSSLQHIPDLNKVSIGDILIAMNGRNPREILKEHAAFEPGPNYYTEMRRAMLILTYRPHKWIPVPAHDSEQLVLQKENGDQYKITIPWQELVKQDCLKPKEHQGQKSHFKTINRASDEFMEDYAKLREKKSSLFVTPRVSKSSNDLSHLHEVANAPVEYKILNDGKNDYGYLRLGNFDYSDNYYIPNIVWNLLSNEFSNTNGLIIDIRSNYGGIINYGEIMLKYFTNKSIDTVDAQMLATQANHNFLLSIRNNNIWNLSDWIDIVAPALSTGQTYSHIEKITPLALVNSAPQLYSKPVIVLTNAGCFSTCDMFAAGIQDNNIGQVWGTEINTGGAGANVIYQQDFYRWTENNPPLGKDGELLFNKLPYSQNMKIAWRKVTRVGKSQGKEIEDIGIKVDRLIPYTRDDLINNDRLIVKELLKELKRL